MQFESLNFDGFAALVATALALACCWAAMSNQDWFFRLKKAQWLSKTYGRTTARIAYLGLGLLLFLLAALLWSGFRVDWS